METRSLFSKTYRLPFGLWATLLSFILMICLSACASSYEPFAYDDIYSVRNNDYPPYESVADQTSYREFKERKLSHSARPTIEQQVVESPSSTENLRYEGDEQNVPRTSKDCADQMRWDSGCGCSYSEWQRTSRYSAYNRSRITIVVGNPFWGLSFGYGYPSLYSPYYSGWGSSLYWGYGLHGPYYGYTPFQYWLLTMNTDNYWTGGYYGHMPYYGIYGIYGYGHYGYGHYGYGGYHHGYGYGNGYLKSSNANSSSEIGKTVYKGPRGMNATGYVNPNGRNYTPNTLHVAKTPTVVTVQEVKKRENSNSANVVAQPMNKSMAVREVGAKETVANIRPTTQPSSSVATKSAEGMITDPPMRSVINTDERTVLNRPERVIHQKDEQVIVNSTDQSPQRSIQTSSNARFNIERSTVAPANRSETAPVRVNTESNQSATQTYRKAYPQRSVHPPTQNPSRVPSTQPARSSATQESSGGTYNRSSVPSSTREQQPARQQQPVRQQQPAQQPSRQQSAPVRTASPPPAPRQQSAASPSRSTASPSRSATPSSGSSSRSSSGSSGGRSR